MSVERAARDAAKYRHRLRDAEAVIAEQNDLLLGIYLRGRLADPTDFDDLIGRDDVIMPSGRIDWDELDRLVDDLLRRKPHLSAGTRTLEPIDGDASGQGPASPLTGASGHRVTGQGPARIFEAGRPIE